MKLWKNLLCVLLALFVMAFCFSLYHYLKDQQEAELAAQQAYERLFTQERDTVARVCNAVGEALASGGTEAACVEASKVAGEAAGTMLRYYGQNYSQYLLNGNAVQVYYGSFWQNVTDILSQGCDTERLENIQTLLTELLALYDGRNEKADEAYQARAFYSGLSDFADRMSEI